jgi:hypothetical protein
MQTLKLSGKFYEPVWFVFDEKSGKLLSDGLALTQVVSDAMEFEDEESAKAEVVRIVQHPEEYPQLPNALALRVVSGIEAKKLTRTRV